MKINTSIAEMADLYLKQVTKAIKQLPAKELMLIISLLEQARLNHNTVYICGNGGSAATASHFAADLCKSTLRADKPGLKAFCLSDNGPLITAWANDNAYEEIFARQITAMARPGDVLVAISCSGLSLNVLKAVKAAKQVGTTTIGLTGSHGGLLKDLVDICFSANCERIDQMEDVHLVLCHILTESLKQFEINDADSTGQAQDSDPVYVSRMSK
jgi:D-sedoheptulose 7-phosphate isomerase